MLIVDPRIGSKDLAAPLKSFGLPVELSKLEYGDVAFIGRGPEERPVLVGVEVKKIDDVVQCIHDGRFAGHQLPGLQESYEVWWLLVEGQIRAGRSGMEVQSSKGHWRPPHGRGRSYEGFTHWMLSMELRAGGRVARTADRAETAAWIASLYRWWTKKPWEKHESIHAIHDDSSGLKAHIVALVRPTKKEMVAAKLVGPKTGMEAARHFPSIAAMVLATEAEWREVKGVGKEKAREVVRLVNEERLRGR